MGPWSHDVCISRSLTRGASLSPALAELKQHEGFLHCSHKLWIAVEHLPAGSPCLDGCSNSWSVRVTIGNSTRREPGCRQSGRRRRLFFQASMGSQALVTLPVFQAHGCSFVLAPHRLSSLVW